MRESLARFGTIMFDRQVMEQMIRAREDVLDCSRWLAIVPEIYRDEAEQCIAKIADDFLGRPLTDDVVKYFISTLHTALWLDVRPR